MLIFRFIISLWLTISIGLYAFGFLSSTSFPFCNRGPTPRSALIGQLTHAWASTTPPCLPLALSCFQLLARSTSNPNITVNYANMWHGEVGMSRSHKIKGGTSPTITFQEQCFLAERGAPTSSAFGTLTFKNLQYITQRRNRKEQKQNKRPPFEV